MNLALIGQSTYNLSGLLVVANELWGHSLAAAIDQRQVATCDTEKFLIYLAGMLAGEPVNTVPDHLLTFVTVHWLAVGNWDELNDSLNYLPAAIRQVVCTGKRDKVLATLDTTLHDCALAVRNLATYDQAVRPFFAQMASQLEQQGLSRLVFPVAAPVTQQKLITRR